jgi:hypothetical protein
MAPLHRGFMRGGSALMGVSLAGRRGSRRLSDFLDAVGLYRVAFLELGETIED